VKKVHYGASEGMEGRAGIDTKQVRECEGAIGGAVRWGGGHLQRQRWGSQKEATGLAEHYYRRESPDRPLEQQRTYRAGH